MFKYLIHVFIYNKNINSITFLKYFLTFKILQWFAIIFHVLILNHTLMFYHVSVLCSVLIFNFIFDIFSFFKIYKVSIRFNFALVSNNFPLGSNNYLRLSHVKWGRVFLGLHSEMRYAEAANLLPERLCIALTTVRNWRHAGTSW